MSTNKQIRDSFEEDRKDPFYSVGRGRRKGKLKANSEAVNQKPRTMSQTLWIFGQTDPNWKWGHLATALAEALPEAR